MPGRNAALKTRTCAEAAAKTVAECKKYRHGACGFLIKPTVVRPIKLRAESKRSTSCGRHLFMGGGGRQLIKFAGLAHNLSDHATNRRVAKARRVVCPVAAQSATAQWWRRHATGKSIDSVRPRRGSPGRTSPSPSARWPRRRARYPAASVRSAPSAHGGPCASSACAGPLAANR